MWKALLPVEGAREARACITEIAELLASNDRTHSSAIEDCEFALLAAYLWLDNPLDRWREETINALNVGIDKISRYGAMSPALFGGLANLGWLISHVTAIVATELDSTTDGTDGDPLNDVDQYLLRLLEEEKCCNGVYDLISGYVGIGLYWLERPRTQQTTRGIMLVLNHLHRVSQPGNPGVAWFTPPQSVPPTQQKVAPAGYFNLGVAHGIPGVLPFLAQVIALRLDRDGVAGKLLDGAIRWLTAQERPPECESRYGSWAIPGSAGSDTRLGWCYGDAGIGAVMEASSRCLKDPFLHAAAANLIESSRRRSEKTAGVVDAPLCHGAFGLGHIFNRFSQWNDDMLSRETARHWYDIGLSMRKPGVGIGGFYAFRPDLTPREQPDASLLSGSLGVALALLASIGTVEPAWDRLLMISTAYEPREEAHESQAQ